MKSVAKNLIKSFRYRLVQEVNFKKFDKESKEIAHEEFNSTMAFPFRF